MELWHRFTDSNINYTSLEVIPADTWWECSGLDVEAEPTHAGDVARDELLALFVRLCAVRKEAVVPRALGLRAGAASVSL